MVTNDINNVTLTTTKILSIKCFKVHRKTNPLKSELNNSSVVQWELTLL